MKRPCAICGLLIEVPSSPLGETSKLEGGFCPKHTTEEIVEFLKVKFAAPPKNG